MKRTQSFAVANIRTACCLVVLKGRDCFPDSKPRQLQDYFFFLLEQDVLKLVEPI